MTAKRAIEVLKKYRPGAPCPNPGCDCNDRQPAFDLAIAALEAQAKPEQPKRLAPFPWRRGSGNEAHILYDRDGATVAKVSCDYPNARDTEIIAHILAHSQGEAEGKPDMRRADEIFARWPQWKQDIARRVLLPTNPLPQAAVMSADRKNGHPSDCGCNECHVSDYFAQPQQSTVDPAAVRVANEWVGKPYSGEIALAGHISRSLNLPKIRYIGRRMSESNDPAMSNEGYRILRCLDGKAVTP